MEKHDEKHVHHCGCGHCHKASESVHLNEEHACHEEDEERSEERRVGKSVISYV